MLLYFYIRYKLREINELIVSILNPEPVGMFKGEKDGKQVF